VECLLRNSGLWRHQLELPGLRVSIEQYSRVLRQLRRQTGDAFMGFLSRPVPPRAFNVFAYSVVGCRNLEELVDHANAFYSLFTRDFYWTLEQQRNDIRLAVHVEPVLPVDYRFIIVSLLLMSIREFGWLLGEDVQPKSTSFSFHAKDSGQSLGYLFGSDIEFGSDSNAVRIDRSYGTAALSSNRDLVTSIVDRLTAGAVPC